MTDIERLLLIQVEGTLRTMQNNKLGKLVGAVDDGILYYFNNKQYKLTCREMPEEVDN